MLPGCETPTAEVDLHPPMSALSNRRPGEAFPQRGYARDDAWSCGGWALVVRRDPALGGGEVAQDAVPIPPVTTTQRVRDLGRLVAATSTMAGASRRTWARRRAGEAAVDALVDELRDGFEHLGPTYVKLGQMVASTPALFPDPMVRGFAGCLDEVRPLDPSVVHRVIAEELGARADEIFASFDDRPLASASIGQVHRAVLESGEDVVVKVQRPGISGRIDADLRILHLLARGAERWSRHARLAQPVAVVEDFAVTLGEELSFMVEARSMEAVQEGLADFPDAHLMHIPDVVWRSTTPRVLTMEYVNGTRLDDVGGLNAMGVDPAALLKTAVLAWLHTTLVHGVFHGDLHAGNLCVDPEGRVVLFDFGICGHLTDDARRSLLMALPALLARDMETVAKALFSADDGGSVDLDGITADLERLVLPIFDQPLEEVSYAQAFVEVVRAGVRHQVLLPRDLVLVFKQFFYVERFTRLLAPDWMPLLDPDLMASVELARSCFDQGWRS